MRAGTVSALVGAALALLLAPGVSAVALGSHAFAPIPGSSPVAEVTRSSVVPSSPVGVPAFGGQASPIATHLLALARAAAGAGASPSHLGLPYIGTPARLENGAVESGYQIAQAASPTAIPMPQGIAYYGENDTAGTVATTTLDASTVAGQVTIDRWNSLYFETGTPQVSGIQLNSALTGVTLQGSTGYEFWVQNALDYNAGNNTLSLGEDTWNMSTGYAYVPTGPSTIAAHSANGSDLGGIYIGVGPSLYAPRPFDLTLYLNSSVTPTGDQKLWYNYSLAASGEPYRHANFDWVVFNSTNAAHPHPAVLAPFEASGTAVTPFGFPEDFEMDVGIGGFNGATNDVLAANLTATLDYCPSAIQPCSASQLRTVPAAQDYGAQTGETGVGIAFAYQGTVAYGSTGPSIPRGLWGFQGAAGNHPGDSAVANRLKLAGSPVSGAGAPYAFVFFEDSSLGSSARAAWAPISAAWHLTPGTYHYDVLLSDYAEATGTLVVGTFPTALNVTLRFSYISGVYTPLWALNASALTAISRQGTGNPADPYELFNNPTESCVACGNASDGDLSEQFFFNYNDYLYPTFPGLLLANSSAYVSIERPVSFTVYTEERAALVGLPPLAVWNFDLPIDLFRTSHVTLRDATVGGWPTMFPVIMVVEVAPAQNPFPQADVAVWDSTSDLIMADRFVGTTAVNASGGACTGICPEIVCGFCTSEDELLFYGGTDNTVWGSSFLDPPYSKGLCSGACAQYAGLAESESGDLVYNNLFQVDNPAMYMAFDLFNDSCWAGYAGDCAGMVFPTYLDRWNVSNASASVVEATVNGVPLAGSIVGPSYPYEGGNVWWNYGDSLNAKGSLPYRAVFDYTHYATNLPIGSVEDEPALEGGGDSVPLPPPEPGGPIALQFRESGLPRGSAWTVAVGNELPIYGANVTVARSSSQSTGTAVVHEAVAGEYSFWVTSPNGYALAHVGPRAHATYAAVNVTRSTTIDLRFGPLETVTFQEKVAAPRWPGVPSGSTWSVVLAAANPTYAPAPPAGSTNATSIEFLLPHGGRYAFTVGPPTGYRSKPVHGTFGVGTHPLLKPVKFALTPAGPVGPAFTPSPPPQSLAATGRPGEWLAAGLALTGLATSAFARRRRTHSGRSLAAEPPGDD